MRILLITQKIDSKDSVLGFMIGWITEFARQFSEVTVICLEKGEYDLPSNVSVYSLGKENGKSRFKYIKKFYSLIISKRNDCDAVFVHMNPEYMILGGLLWRLWGKKAVLWYNHSKSDLKLRVASVFSNILCHTSPFAATAGRAKSRMMPVGIDTDMFRYDGSIQKNGRKNHILSLGRIAPIKKVDVIVKAAIKLLKEGSSLRLTIIGDALPKDLAYRDSIKKIINESAFKDEIVFIGAESDRVKVSQLFNANQFFINASPAGLFDKTVFEAIASGCIPLVSSKAFEGIIPKECFFIEGDIGDLASKLKNLIGESEDRLESLSESMRGRVVEQHGLRTLVIKIKSLFV